MSKKKLSSKKLKKVDLTPTKEAIKLMRLPDFKPDQILFHNRWVGLCCEINEYTARDINASLLAMDILSQKPIIIKINSDGGSCWDGLSIIDTIATLSSPTVSFICGCAASIAAIISVGATTRMMTRNSVWMIHPMRVGVLDTLSTARDREKLWSTYEKIMEDILKTRTKLSPEEIIKAKTGEIWLTAQECLNKGVVDRII